jgi:MFS family permease
VAALDALTFVAAALAVATLQVTESPLDVDDPDERLRDRMAAGASFLKATPVLLHTTVAIGLSLLMIGSSESGIFAVVDAFDRPATFVGTMLSMQGVGAIVGGLLASRLVRRLGEPRTVVLGLVVLGVGLGGVTGAVRLWQLLAAVAVLGAGIPLLLIAFLTLLQRRTPGHLMGRVSTFVEVLTTLPQALSIAVGALLVTLVDYRVVFGVMTAGVLLAAAYPVLVLRDRLRPDGPDDGSATTAGPATPSVAAAGPEAGAPATVLPEPGAAPVPPPVTRAD